MKTTTVRELRNNYAQVLRWVSAGQEVSVTRRGKIVAKVVPPTRSAKRIDWTQSAAHRLTTGEKLLTATQSEHLIRDASGNW